MSQVLEEQPIKVFGGTTPKRSYQLRILKQDDSREPYKLDDATAIRLVVAKADDSADPEFILALATGITVIEDGTDPLLDYAQIDVQFPAIANLASRWRYAIVVVKGTASDIVRYGPFITEATPQP